VILLFFPQLVGSGTLAGQALSVLCSGIFILFGGGAWVCRSCECERPSCFEGLCPCPVIIMASRQIEMP